MCRLMLFFRTFGLYLSGFIVVSISFDRYFAVLRPLALPEANRRGKVMLFLAWAGALVCSLPQVCLLTKMKISCLDLVDFFITFDENFLYFSGLVLGVSP